MLKPKPLHLRKNIDELMKLAAFHDMERRLTKNICCSAEAFLTAARAEYEEGDEEVAFVYFRKFVALYHIMRQRPDFMNEEEFVHDKLGNFSSIVDEFIGIQFSLVQRYKEAGFEDSASASESDMEIMREEIKREYQEQLLEPQIGDMGLLREIKREKDDLSLPPQSISPLSFPSLSMSPLSLPPLSMSPLSLPPQKIDMDMIWRIKQEKEEPLPPPKMISCEDLYQLMKDNKENMLVTDCRSENDFASSRLIYKDYSNISEEVIRNRLSGKNFRDLFVECAPETWLCCETLAIRKHIELIPWKKDFIVLMDRSTPNQCFADSPMEILRSFIAKDPEMQYKCFEILALDGGFEKFKRIYPEWTVDLKDI